MLPAMKALFLAFVFMSCGLLPAISDDAQLKAGSMAVARDPTGTVLGADSTQSLDKLMEFARGQDLKAIRELMREATSSTLRAGRQLRYYRSIPVETPTRCVCSDQPKRFG